MLNYEINLQFEENIKNRRLSGSPLAITGLFIIGLVLVAGVYASALLYANHLRPVIIGYEAEVNKLSTETMPLEALEERILIISLKADLKDEIQSPGLPVSKILQQVNSKLSENLSITSVTVEKGGIVYIVGIGTKMQSIAAYNYALNDLSFVEAADITEIKLAESGSYYFKLELRPREGYIHEAGK